MDTLTPRRDPIIAGTASHNYLVIGSDSDAWHVLRVGPHREVFRNEPFQRGDFRPDLQKQMP